MRYSITVLLWLSIAPASLANNPASTAYVDRQVALAKAALVHEIENTPALAHPVGSCYGGGVVFYVNTTRGAPAGQGGLIAALTDAGNFYWSNNSSIAAGTTQRGLFTGASNTNNLLTIGNTPAAIAANSYTDGVYHDWYLPSQDELTALSIQVPSNPNLFTACQGTAPSTANSYWSSSQYDADNMNAYYVNFGNGVVYVGPLGSNFLVRAIRSF